MGADGGYAHIDRDAMVAYLGPDDVKLFVRFVERMFYYPQVVSINVRAWEKENLNGKRTIRLPTGSNFVDVSSGAWDVLLSLSHRQPSEFKNPVDLVMMKAFLYDLAEEDMCRTRREEPVYGERYYGKSYGRAWWCNPLSWWIWDGEERLIQIPNQTEFEKLKKVADYLEEAGYTYCETWT